VFGRAASGPDFRCGLLSSPVPMNSNNRSRRDAGLRNLRAELTEMLVGQPEAVDAVIPYVLTYEAGLAPEGRPAGIFLLLGPTGTGKTKTVESLAEVLHGSSKRMLKIDCAEFQMEHEVAKLIGAPPGYLGHRETQPMLTQARLNAVTSEESSLSIVLLDEIEKAAPTMARLLLGVLDKATLRLGDNTTVNFEHSLIFLTSNLGAREMQSTLRPGMGFEAVMVPPDNEQPDEAKKGKLEAIGWGALRRRFSPEFLNRLDRVVTYKPLSDEALDRILELQIYDFFDLVENRLGPRAFDVTVDAAARQFLLEQGASAAYGARELKRALQRHLFQPLAMLVANGSIPPGCCVRVTCPEESVRLRFRIAGRRRPLEPPMDKVA
jgi:ATP-dependent Clp protease ATP-binding subunit ClpA